MRLIRRAFCLFPWVWATAKALANSRVGFALRIDGEQAFPGSGILRELESCREAASPDLAHLGTVLRDRPRLNSHEEVCLSASNLNGLEEKNNTCHI